MVPVSWGTFFAAGSSISPAMTCSAAASRAAVCSVAISGAVISLKAVIELVPWLRAIHAHVQTGRHRRQRAGRLFKQFLDVRQHQHAAAPLADGIAADAGKRPNTRIWGTADDSRSSCLNYLLVRKVTPPSNKPSLIAVFSFSPLAPSAWPDPPTATVAGAGSELSKGP